MIEEIARAKRAYSRRITQSVLQSPPLHNRPGDNHGGTESTGAGGGTAGVTPKNTENAAAVYERAKQQRQRWGAGGSKHATEPRYSKFAVSVVIPQPQQHDGVVTTGSIDHVGSKNRGMDNRDARGNSAGKRDNKVGNRTTPLSSRVFSTSSKPVGGGRKSTLSAGGEQHVAPAANKTRHGQFNTAAVRSTIKLDIVKTDMERDGGGGVTSPIRSGGAGAGAGELGSSVGGGAAATAKSDSSAREVLRWYIDEQVVSSCGTQVWRP